MPSWVPTYAVKVNGTELPKIDDLHLQQITVELRRQAPASVELQFNNHEGKYDERDDLGPGSEIEVSLGYTDTEKTKVYTGEIIGTVVRLQENGPRSFVVRSFDFLHRLTRGRKTRTFLEQKFSDIVKQVGQDHGLTVDAEDTAFVREYVIQHNQTDLDFSRGIAGWLDFDLHVRHLEDAKKLRFKKPDVASDPVMTAVYEKADFAAGETALRRFDGRQSLARVVSEVVVRGWDPKTKKEIIGTAAASDIYGKMGGETSALQEVADKWGETERQLVDYKVFTTDEAKKIALTKINEYARTFIRADIEVQGCPAVHPGSVVKFTRVGPRMDGLYFVESVTHLFTSPVGPGGGYTTRLIAQRCAW